MVRGVGVDLVLLHSVSDVYLVEAAGPDGHPVRRRTQVAGEVVEEIGDPLPAERVTTDTDDPEDVHVGILEGLIQAPPRDMMAARFVVVG